MPSLLWTPGGDRVIDETQRNVRAIDPREMAIFAAMHTIGQKYSIVVACEHCRRPFKGFNSGQGPTQSVVCGCRELKATVRPQLVTG